MSANQPNHMSLDQGRKLEYLKETPKAWQEYANFRVEAGIKPNPLRCETNTLTTKENIRKALSFMSMKIYKLPYG